MANEDKLLVEAASQYEEARLLAEGLCRCGGALNEDDRCTYCEAAEHDGSTGVFVALPPSEGV